MSSRSTRKWIKQVVARFFTTWCRAVLCGDVKCFGLACFGVA